MGEDKEEGQVLWIYPWDERWAAYISKYPKPIGYEKNYMFQFVTTFPFESPDFVDTKLRDRHLLIQHLHQVRTSKGYDVEHYIPSLSPFIPSSSMEGKKRDYQNKAMDAARIAMATINHHTWRDFGRIFEMVRIDRYVWTTPPYKLFLLTLVVKDVDGDTLMEDAVANADADEADDLVIRAMVFDNLGGGFELLQWDFKT